MPTSTKVKNLNINELTEAQYDAAVQGGVIGANELSVLTDVSYVEPSDLATVATTGDYSDLINRPTNLVSTNTAQTISGMKTFSGDITLSGTTSIKNNTGGTNYTMLYRDASTIHIGGSTSALKLEGSGTRPAYNNDSLALLSDVTGGLPSQTGQSGKFLTTDGTNASWSNKPLVNNATGVGSLVIGSGSASGSNTISVGGATSSGNSSIFIGNLSQGTNVQNEIAIGWYAAGGAENGITIGGYTSSGAVPFGTICIGRYANPTPIRTENEKGTFWVTLWTSISSSGTYKLMSSDGTIPTARLTKVNTTITLAAADWNAGTQTVSVTGMTATGIVLVSPDPTDQSAYTSAGIICSAQAAGTLTFTCSTTPTADLSVNVVML